MILSIKSKLPSKACKVFMFCLPFTPPHPPPGPSLQPYTATMKDFFLKHAHPSLHWQFQLILQDLLYVSPPLIRHPAAYSVKGLTIPFFILFFDLLNLIGAYLRNRSFSFIFIFPSEVKCWLLISVQEVYVE